MYAQDVPFGREQSSFAGPPPFNDEEEPTAYQPGFVKRAATFPEHLKRAEGYQHDPRLTKLALIRDLALGCPELSDAAFREVVTLIILVPPAAWDSGRLLVHIGNRLLGRLLGCSDPALRRSGRELEEAALMLRHMDEANHPAAGRRFDLRPLAARHAEISTRIAETFAAHQRARAERRFCHTAPDSASRPEEPAGGPAPAETSPQGQSDPHGGRSNLTPPYIQIRVQTAIANQYTASKLRLGITRLAPHRPAVPRARLPRAEAPSARNPASRGAATGTPPIPHQHHAASPALQPYCRPSAQTSP